MSGSEGEDQFHSEEEEEEYACADEDQGQPQIIWLPEEDQEDQLPSLLNNSARRKKTWETFVAHRNLHDHVVRCKEFPHGVYIDRFGKAQPQDARSHLYWTRSEWRAAHPEAEAPGDGLGDEHGTEPWAAEPCEAQKLSSAQRPRSKSSDSDVSDPEASGAEEEEEDTEEEDYDPTDEDEEDQFWQAEEAAAAQKKRSKAETKSKATNSKAPDPASTDPASADPLLTDPVPAAPRKRKRIAPDSDEEEDDEEEDGDTWNSEDEDFVADSDEEEEEETEEEEEVVHAPSGPETEQERKMRVKRQKLLSDLHRGAEQLNHMQTSLNKRRQQHLQSQMLNQKLERHIDRWHKAVRAAKRQKQAVPIMTFNSHFLSDEPRCDFYFDWGVSRTTTASPPRWHAAMQDASLRCACDCGFTVSSLEALLPHLQAGVCPPVTPVTSALDGSC
jgi:hypothetical protein